MRNPLNSSDQEHQPGNVTQEVAELTYARLDTVANAKANVRFTARLVGNVPAQAEVPGQGEVAVRQHLGQPVVHEAVEAAPVQPVRQETPVSSAQPQPRLESNGIPVVYDDDDQEAREARARALFDDLHYQQITSFEDERMAA